MMMPCAVQKGYMLSTDSDKEVKLIAGHAFFLPKGGGKAYFLPVESSKIINKT